MPHFPLLAEPAAYRPCDWDFLADAEGRGYFLKLFWDMATVTEAAAVESGYPAGAAAGARDELRRRVELLRKDPTLLGGLDILALDILNGRILRDFGIEDAFRAIKARENEAALALLPARLASIDASTEPGSPGRALELVKGVFAGNIFDMGAKATAARFAGGLRPTFDAFLRDVRPRPWVIDHAQRVRLGGRRKAALFVDNAGADVVLGMLPLARELVRGGAEVLLAANTGAAWNDITAAELETILDRVEDGTLRDAMTSGRLGVVATGTRAPLLDLAAVSQGLVDASRDADLVVLEGMGRSLESNWDARLTCETWRLATLKDPAIARRKGGDLYDCVCRVDGPA